MRLLLRLGFVVILAILLIVFFVALSDNATNSSDPSVAIDTEEFGTELESFAEESVETAENIAEQTVDVAQDIWIRLTTAPSNNVVRVLMAVVGAVLLVAGWRIYDEIVLLAGVFTGAMIASSLVPEANTLLQVAALLIGGLIGAVLSIFLFYVAVFFIGAYVGLNLSAGVAAMLNIEPVSSLVLLIGALIGGVLLLGLSGQLLIIVSALIGAQFLAIALNLPAFWVLVLTLIGVVLQFVLANRFNVSIYRRPRTPYYISRFGF